jgi:hypothetical protein
MTDWSEWHQAYQDASSSLSDRLRVVQQRIDDWLDVTAPDPVTVVSACAGDGRDLLGVLEHRSDRARVSATLLETDRRNAARAVDEVSRLGLTGVAVRRLDAGISDAYAGAVPADLVLLCGIFGNITDDDVHGTIRKASQLCRRGAVVIWTRHRRPPDLTPNIRRWFSDHEFVEVDFVAPDGALFSVGVHRFIGEPAPLGNDVRLFTFTR